MTKLFGTDGIRGVAGQFPLSFRDVHLIGRVAGRVLREKTRKFPCRVLIVRDTRHSGEVLLEQLSTGLREQGIEVFDGGVLSTPAAAFLVRAHRFDSGVVISASHNPPKYNGIKFFDPHSRKWPDEWEDEVERRFAHLKLKGATFRTKSHAGQMGGLVQAGSLETDYEDFLAKTLNSHGDLSGIKLVVDCSNGANYQVAPRLFRSLGVSVQVIHAKPDGSNINVDCGSQHTAGLSNAVRAMRADAGVAFDGDGDRVIFVDEKGRDVDGDHIIAILARDFKNRKLLKKDTVVITVMANLGLKLVLNKMKVKSIEVPVGDRFVSAAMKKSGAVLGGEQSGHIILGRYLPTGDGLLTSIHVLSAYKRERKPFSKLAGLMKKFPQVLLNVPVKEKVPLSELDGVEPLVKKTQQVLGDKGRVLVRYSGTESLLRIMLEGPDKNKLKIYAESIASLVRRADG